MLEVDFLAVGNHGRSGDAIAIRLTEPRTHATRIILVDAGFAGAGEDLVGHVHTHYGTDAVDLLVSTHPHQDHTTGLRDVFDGLAVKRMWAHDPASHGAGAEIAQAGRDIRELAREHSVPVDEPFAGRMAFNDAIAVLGPSPLFYGAMLQRDRGTQKVLEAAHSSGVALATRVKALKPVPVMPFETLTDDSGGTDPINNTSVVLSVLVGSSHVLLTADAGVPALRAAWEQSAALRGYVPFSHVQVPHHGSRHNVDAALLDDLLGPKASDYRGEAIASVAREAHEHPRAAVTNAFTRRGFHVAATKGNTICWSLEGAPYRPGWGPVAPFGPLDERE